MYRKSIAWIAREVFPLPRAFLSILIFPAIMAYLATLIVAARDGGFSPHAFFPVFFMLAAWIAMALVARTVFVTGFMGRPPRRIRLPVYDRNGDVIGYAELTGGPAVDAPRDGGRDRTGEP